MVRIWDAVSAQEISALSGHSWDVQTVAWSSDDRCLATGDRLGSAKIWDAASAKPLRDLVGHGEQINSVAWAPTGGRVATASNDGSVRIWDVETARELFPLFGHGGPVTGVAWSPDGTRLATSSRDGFVLTYVMDLHGLISLTRGRTTRNLTLNECRTYLHVEEVPPIPFGPSDNADQMNNPLP